MFNLRFVFFLLSLWIVSGCSPQKSEEEEQVLEDSTSGRKVLRVGDFVLSIPSPIRLAMMMKESKASYRKEDWADVLKGKGNYHSDIKKGICLGIFGSDLGYCLVFSQAQDALLVLQKVKGLTDDLGLSELAGAGFLDRFNRNISNKDSTFSLLSDLYRDADEILKDQGKNELNASIMTGIWLESLHLMCSSGVSTGSLAPRIGEMKISLEMLTQMLSGFPENNELLMVANHLDKLYEVFNEIEIQYTYKPSVHDPSKAHTTVMSESTVIITQEQLARIRQVTLEIRKEWI